MQTVERTSEHLSFVKYWLILKRRWLPAVAVAGGLFIVLALNALSKPNLYQAKGQLRFNLNEDKPNVIGIQGLGESAAVGNERQLASEIRNILSRSFLLSVIQRLPATLGEGNVRPSVDTVKNSINILPVQGTDVVEVSFIGNNAEFALQVVNQLMQVYVQSNLQSNRAKSRTTREFIVGQIPQVRQRVFVADSALRRFKETYRVVDLAATKSAATEGQVKVLDQLGVLETQLAEINSQLGTLRQQLGVNAQQAVAVSAVGQSPAVQDVLTSVEQVQKQLKEARTRFAPDHPAILDLQDRQQELQALLRERVKASLNGNGSPIQGSLFVGATRQGLLDSLIKYEAAKTALLQQQQVLIGQKNVFATQAQVIPGLEQRQRELERELGAAESTYQSLLKSLQDIQVTENQIIPTVKIIDSAVLPTVPIAPNRGLDLIRNAVGALLVGAAVAYLLEIADRRFKTVDSIQAAYPYPLLGNIPMFEVSGQEFRKVPVFAEPHSLVSEAYRMLQANLKFLRSDAPVRIITVTSAQPNEGKSVTASNLAAVLSQIGHRVLLIDGDLRRPTTHQIWEIPNGLGLSNVLTTTDKKDFSTLPAHFINDRLQVLTAGPIPPNPLALLDSERMASFLKAQIKNFDYILIDTPPVSVSADPLVVSRFTDGILLVARPEVLEKGSSRLVQSSLEQSGVNVLGIVANGVILKNESYSYYYYTKNYYSEDKTEASETNDYTDKEEKNVANFNER
ncbi:MAG: polysaccharide biosynthesis tyrosine autokinase [Thermosynechococcaceae cyanobacterium MS004]|nr:polysaccharide biosynthesis tyrosine autokinase [Thermosynechococcaceae cyanobacterium MS004]